MIGIVKKFFGTKYDRDVKTYSPVVEEINEHFEGYKSCPHNQFDRSLIVTVLLTSALSRSSAILI